jgi:hypothetical protein
MIAYHDAEVYEHLQDAGIDSRHILGAMTRLEDDGLALGKMSVGLGVDEPSFIEMTLLTLQEINTLRMRLGLLPLGSDPATLHAVLGNGVIVPEVLHHCTPAEYDSMLGIRHDIRDEERHSTR